MTGIEEWLDENAKRAYPFRDDADFTTDSGYSVPTWCLLDLFVSDSSVHADSASVPVFRLEKMVVTEAEGDGNFDIELVFSKDGRESFSTTAAYRKDREFAYIRQTAFADSSSGIPELCMMVRSVGGAAGLEHPFDIPVGEHPLSNPPEILPSRVAFLPNGVGLYRLQAGGEQASGVVHLRDGSNCTLRIRNGQIVMSVGRGLGTGFVCTLPEDDEGGANMGALLMLNGQRSDTNGNITVAGGEGVTVSSGSFEGIPGVVLKAGKTVDNIARPLG